MNTYQFAFANGDSIICTVTCSVYDNIQFTNEIKQDLINTTLIPLSSMYAQSILLKNPYKKVIICFTINGISGLILTTRVYC